MNDRRVFRPVAFGAFQALVAVACCVSAQAQTITAAPAGASALALPAAVSPTAPPLGRTVPTSRVTMAVTLTDASLLQVLGANAKKTGITMSVADRRAYVANLQAKQSALMTQIAALGGTEISRLTKTSNTLVVAIDASKLPNVSRLPGVSSMLQVRDYSKNLLTSVPYVGARAVQALGYDGTGIKVAVLDSGIDYTHRNLGGSGTGADFATASAAAAGLPPASLFPSAKVIGGYDFVGERWTGAAGTPPLAPDANPIDAGTAAGHGTHVADIVAGLNGVAPGAKLYAVKVCSSVSTSCSGVAILNGLEWAADPNGDFDFSDAPDVINMSLGGAYGPRENPQSASLTNLVRFGIVAVVSAGNSGDRPFILGGPSNTPEVISVAQTAMPQAQGFPLVVTAPASIAGTYGDTNTVDWAPIGSGFSGVVRLAGRACPANTVTPPNPVADPIPDLTGRVALVDRGGCSISLKVDYAAQAGASAVIIANNAAGDAPSFSFGGGANMVPTLVVTQARGTMLKSVANDSAQVVVGGATAVPLVGSIVSTSSRGPNFNFSGIKPEIGAPGGSLSAEYGTGTGETAFSGTSGAAPMVSGAVALLLQRFPAATPPEIKARLMNAAETTIYSNPLLRPGVLAPITRIGGGELRVDRSLALRTGVWDASNPYSVGLSFGSARVIGTTTLSKKVSVRNYAATQRTYTITRGFRFADDAANGAVTLAAPASITVPANGVAAFTLTMSVNANQLPAWTLSAPANQGIGTLLDGLEYDGYLALSDGTETVTVPWHVLPHKATNVTASTTLALGGATTGALPISNLGAAVPGELEVFALTGTSPQISSQAAPYGGGAVLVDMKAFGVRTAASASGPVLQFAVATYAERTHPTYPAEFDIYIDVDNDGNDDYVLYNYENTGFGLSGQTVVGVVNLATGSTVTRYFADADLNSSNMIMTALASDIGLTNLNRPISYYVLAFDSRISGNLTDISPLMTLAVGSPRFTSPLGNSLTVPVGFSGSLPVGAPAAGAAASPAQSGLLLLHRHGRTGRESDVVTIQP